MGNDPVPVIPATWTRYSKLQTVGAGSYGQVYLAEGNPEKGGMEGVHVVKRVHVADLPEEEMRGAINEVQILSLLNHFNIISYTDHFVDADGFLNIVMEHCSQGDLSKRIETCKAANSHFKQNEIAFWAFQLAQGMKYIHSIGIIHRDLKPANIFLTANNTLRIADFGISKLVSATSVAQTVIGTPFYIAPEICENRSYTNSADVWSAGCVLYELAALEKPFVGSNILAVVKRVTEGVYTPLHKRYSKLAAMVARMLVVDTAQRASITQIIDDFFTGVTPTSLPAPSLEGLQDDDVEGVYAQWQNGLKKGASGGGDKSREQSPSTSSPRERRRSLGASERKKKASGGGKSSLRSPELEIHLLPSQRCLLVEEDNKVSSGTPSPQNIHFRGTNDIEEDSESDSKRVKKRKEKDKKRRPGSGKRKKEKKEKKERKSESGKTLNTGDASSKHNTTMSTTVVSSSSSADDSEEDGYSLDDFEKADELSPCDCYSNESFEKYHHDDLTSPEGGEGRARGGGGGGGGANEDQSHTLKISDQEWHNICRAREIDRNTDEQATKLRARCDKVNSSFSPL